jgi:spore germination cell wall hydrolase CwlJ-like protein
MKKYNTLYYSLGALILIALILFAQKANAVDVDSDSDRFCLALNIYFEAGNQPFSGKLAVANVTLNRVIDPQFPDNICKVVYQSKEFYISQNTGELIPVRGMCQFSWYCDGKPDVPLDSVTWLEAIRVADMVRSNKYIDITNGALYYHADYIYPYWADHLERLVRIENHIFYK